MVSWDPEEEERAEDREWLRPVLLYLLAVEVAFVVGLLADVAWRGL